MRDPIDLILIVINLKLARMPTIRNTTVILAQSLRVLCSNMTESHALKDLFLYSHVHFLRILKLNQPD